MALSLTPQQIVDKDEYDLLKIAGSWLRVPLRAVATVQNGFAFKSEFFDRTDGMPLIRIRDVTKEETEHRYRGEYLEEYVVRNGDILVGMDGDFKAAKWQGLDALLNQRVCRLVVTSDFYDRDFFFLCLQPYLNAINAETSSVTVKHLSSRSVQDIPLPLPPLNEQRRIVEKIENLFAELDKGEESLKAAKARAGLYRQSLLKHAFEGHLTAEWRAANPDKLEDPEALLTRIQNERDARYKQALDDWQSELEKWRDEGEEGKKPKKPKRLKDLQAPKQDNTLPDGWAKVPLGMVVDEPNYGTSKKCDYNAGPVGVLRIPNISEGKIDSTDLKSAEFTRDEIESYELETGDLLVIRSNGSVNLVGKGALVQEQHTDFLYAGYLIRLRSNARVALPRYLHLAMMSHVVRSQIESKAKSTSGVNNINSGELQSLVLSLCSVAEQVMVADRLDAKLSTLEAVEKQLDEQLARSRALRQSILKRAFAGELVDQDPNDEPASVLLERIKAEKAEAELAAKRYRKIKPVRKPKNRRPTMTDLIEVLKKEGDWVSASKAAQGLGIADGTSSDDVEAFYRQLKERIEANEIEVERRGDEDWLRLAKVEAT